MVGEAVKEKAEKEKAQASSVQTSQVTVPTVPAVFLPAAIDACALYRQYIPSLSLENALFIIPTAKLTNGMRVPGPVPVDEIAHCRVAIVQRLVSEHNRNAIKTLRQAGLKVIYDADDDLWNLPSYNPGKQLFTAMRQGFTDCCKEADMITVSTRGLKTAAKNALPFSKEILVVPNSIDLNLFCRKEIERNDGFTVIGWGGSNTHSTDVKDAFEVVEEVLNICPQARMEIIGAPGEGYITEESLDDRGRRVYRKVKVFTKINRHPQTRFRPWVPVPEYANRLASWAWDISLAPLEPNRFNRSKSNIKMLEAAALKIPCLVSDVQPYSEFCELSGGELNWLLCRSQKDWKDKLTALINEPERRDHYGQKMYEVADKWFNITRTKELWKHAFQTSLNQ